SAADRQRIFRAVRDATGICSWPHPYSSEIPRREHATPDIKSGAAYARVLERTYPDMEEKGAAIQFLQEGAASFDDLCLAARSRKKMGATIATALAVGGRHRAA